MVWNIFYCYILLCYQMRIHLCILFVFLVKLFVAFVVKNFYHKVHKELTKYSKITKRFIKIANHRVWRG